MRIEHFELGDLVHVYDHGYGRVMEQLATDHPEHGPMYKVDVFGGEATLVDATTGQPFLIVAGKDMTIKVKKNEWLTEGAQHV